MFGRRPDGKRIKTLAPIPKIIPHIMSARHDSQNLFKYEVLCDSIDKFILEQREKDCSLTYMHVVIAAIVRLIALRPQLNRFVVNGRVFKRKNICVSYVVKKSLRDDVEETTVKLELTGKESIYETNAVISAERDSVDSARVQIKQYSHERQRMVKSAVKTADENNIVSTADDCCFNCELCIGQVLFGRKGDLLGTVGKREVAYRIKIAQYDVNSLAQLFCIVKPRIGGYSQVARFWMLGYVVGRYTAAHIYKCSHFIPCPQK